MRDIKQKNCEILAPAGSPESLIAAVRAGADAVYLGHEKLSARRNAANFSDETLKEAVSYCKVRNCKTYLTLNTSVKNNEIKDCFEVLSLASYLNIDAVIIQDMALYHLIKNYFPNLQIHGSTQMSVSNIFGVNQLKQMGFSRAVLARELSKNEIEIISNKTDMELEVFVHGALCMSVSGRCLLSSMIGTRSGNRGLCAQPCRLDFDLATENQVVNFKNIKQREMSNNILSLKDLSLINYVNELQDMGVRSLKIEGRMKRPEYVACAVKTYKKALEIGTNPTTDQLKEFNELQSQLQSVFSRSGFTQSYYKNNIDSTMFGIRQKDDVTNTSGVLKDISQIYKNETPLVPLTGEFSAHKNQHISFKISDSHLNVMVQGDKCTSAINNPTTSADILKQLSKTGNTPFYFKNNDDLKINIDDDIYIPVSALNKLRRDAFDEYTKIKSAVNHEINPVFDEDIVKTSNTNISTSLNLRGRFKSVSQLSSIDLDKLEYIILPLFEITSYVENNAKNQLTTLFLEKIIVEMPDMTFSEKSIKNIEDALTLLKKHKINNAMSKTINDINLLTTYSFNIFGDYSLNCINTLAAAEYKNIGVQDLTLSVENSQKGLKYIDFEGAKGVIGYGFLPLMSFRSCPLKNSKNNVNCGDCKKSSYYATDNKGRFFPVNCLKSSEVSMLYNSEPLFLADKLDDFSQVNFMTLFFTSETSEKCAEIVNLYYENISSKTQNCEMPKNYTRGLYYRNLL